MTTKNIVSGKFELSVEYDDFSPPWKTDKSHLLLQHGFARTAQIWNTWVPLVGKDFPVIRPTLRGMTHPPASFSHAADINMEGYLSDLCRLLDSLDVEAVHYCGESFGGCIGLAFAARHPDRVRSLSLLSTPVFVGAKWSENYSMGYPSWSKALEALGMHAWLEATNRSTRFPPSVGADLIDWYSKMALSCNPEVLLGMARLIEKADLRSCLPSISCPVMLMTPVSGNIMDEDQIKAYETLVKNFHLIRFNTRYHKIQLLEAASCAGYVSAFCALSDQKGSSGFN